MKIINRSGYRTDDLRALINRVAQDELDPAKRARVTFTVTRARRKRLNMVCGCASVGGSWATLKLQHAKHGPYSESGVADVAMVIAHEMAHLRGMRHNAMRGIKKYTWRPRLHGSGSHYVPVEDEMFYQWAKDFQLRPAEAKSKPGAVDIAEARHLHAARMAQEWARRARLAKNREKKWNQRCAYYSKRLAAMQTQRAAENIADATGWPIVGEPV